MPEYPQLPFFDSVGDTPNILVGSPIASANSISIDHGIHHVTGTATISTIVIPWSGFSGTCYFIADAAWSLTTGGNINSALTASTGNVIQLTYDPTNSLWYPVLLTSTGGNILPFVADNTGVGNGVITGRKTPSGGSVASNFLNVTGTLPAAASTSARGILVSLTTQGSSIQAHQGFYVELLPGLVSAANTFGAVITNSVAGQNAGSIVANGGNYGAYVTCVGTGSVVTNIAGRFQASGAGTTNVGILGISGAATGSPTTNIGGAFFAVLGSSINIAVLAVLDNVAVTNTTAALLCDNSSQAAPIAIFRDGGSPVFTIDDGGNFKYLRTVTAGGTTGNQTIDKPVGTVNFAAGASVITVTNALVVSTSIIFGVIRTADATATFIKSIVPGAGSFVITLNAVATAETSVGFMVTN